MEKLSSGLRINKAGDDAAGLAISEKMRGQIRGLDMASKNSQDGISMLQTAEGALNETHDILQRMKELATQAANDTNTTDDRGEIQKEINQLTSEINRIGNTTEFNTQKLLDGGETQRAANAGGAEAIKTAAVSGTDIADVTALDYSGTALTFEINDTEVTLSDASYADMDALKTALQGAIDDAGIEGVTVGADGSKLTLSSSSDIKIAAASSGDIADLGLTAGTTTAVAEEVESEAGESYNATLQIGANKGQAFSISILDMRASALGISQSSSNEEASKTAAVSGTDIADVTALDYSGTALTFEINDTEVTLSDASYADMDALKTALQGAIDDAGIEGVTVGADGSKLTLSSSSDIKIAAASSGDIADLGLTAGTTTAVAEEAEGGSTAFTSKAEVTNGTTSDTTESALDVSTHANATNAIEVLDKAIAKVSGERSKLGAYQNRLEHTINNLNTSSENLTAAESRIRDVDMAKEMMNQTKNSILSQAAQAMLAQSNQMPQGVLQLLR
ncbi:hypothetical protein CP883_09670 [Cutibacterium acnes]|nr:hypothetical protein CP883_09670 [Cutibacterium acnes]